MITQPSFLSVRDVPARFLCALVFAGVAACDGVSTVGPTADASVTDVAADTAKPDDGATPSDVTPPSDVAPPSDVTPPSDVAPPSDGGLSDWGFRPMPDGFMFENYINGPGTTNLTPVEVRRLFGPTVCQGSAATGTCTLTPQARQWMEQQNAGMNGGHCEGLAVAASLLYSGVLMPSAFGGASTFGLPMAMNEALQREIALWFVTQATLPNEQRDQTPRDVVMQLERDFAAGRAFRGTVLGVYTSPGRGNGHAITPYAVRRPTPTTAEILAYDNNYPTQEKIVSVDLTANTFRYVTTTNPKVVPTNYVGDAMTRTLNLADIAPRLVLPHVCTFCGDAEMMTGTSMRGSVQVALTGAGDVDIVNAAGQHTGTGAGGAILNNIPGSNFASVRSSREGDSPEPLYTVPREGTLTINLDGSRLTAAAPDSDLLITGQGFSLSVENINLDPMQRDTLTFRTDAPDIAYRASGSETPTLVLAFQRPGADYLVELRSGAFTTGQVLRLAVNFTTQTVRVSFDGSTSAPTFEYYMERISDAGAITTFRHAGVASMPASVLNFSYASWAGDGMPVSVGVDTNGDGTVDRTDMLTDEP